MFCKNCGKELQEGENFCGKCGCKVGSSKINSNKKQGNKRLKIYIPIIIIIIIIIGIVGVILLNQQSNNKTIDEKKEQQTEIGNTNNESGEKVVATMKIKGKGTIKLELYYDEAPNTVKNFIALANNGFYDNLTFHRLVKDFIIQGGDPKGDGTGNATLKDIKKGGNKEYCIKGEFGANNVQNKISFEKGVIAMARADYSYMYEELTPDGYDSASSQFFIMTADHTELNNQYAGFGKVIEGMELIEKLNNIKVDSATDKPLETIIIEQIRVDTGNQNYDLPETLDVLDYENYVVTGQRTYKKENTDIASNENNTNINSNNGPKLSFILTGENYYSYLKKKASYRGLKKEDKFLECARYRLDYRNSKIYELQYPGRPDISVQIYCKDDKWKDIDKIEFSFVFDKEDELTDKDWEYIRKLYVSDAILRVIMGNTTFSNVAISSPRLQHDEIEKLREQVVINGIDLYDKLINNELNGLNYTEISTKISKKIIIEEK